MPSTVHSYIDYRELSTSQRQDVRASQRTFQGSYLRTALQEMTFALFVLRLFRKEFLPIGTVYTVHATLMLLLTFYQQNHANREFLGELSGEFTTNGTIVLLSTVTALAAQIVLLVLLIRLG